MQPREREEWGGGSRQEGKSLLLVRGLLLLGERTPACAELLADLAEGQVGRLRDDLCAHLLGEEHVARDLLLAAGLQLLEGDEMKE